MKVEKVVLKEGNPEMFNYREEERKDTYDIIGRHLYDFKRFERGDSDLGSNH
jgi:hypothetical protein